MSARQRSRRRHVLRALVLLGGISLLAPLYLMLVFATHTDAEIMSMPAPLWFGSHLEGNLRELFARLPHFAANLWMSLRAASTTALLQVVLCSIAGYAFAMMRFRGKDVLFALVLATLLLPGSLGMIPRLLLIEKLGWYDTVRGLAIPSAASAPRSARP